MLECAVLMQFHIRSCIGLALRVSEEILIIFEILPGKFGIVCEEELETSKQEWKTKRVATTFYHRKNYSDTQIYFNDLEQTVPKKFRSSLTYFFLMNRS